VVLTERARESSSMAKPNFSDNLVILLVVGSGIVLLLNFVLLLLSDGELLIYEHNRIILWAETIGSGAMFLFGLYKFLNVLKKTKEV